MRHLNKKTEIVLIGMMMAVMCALGCLGFWSALAPGGLAKLTGTEVASVLFGLSGGFFGVMMLFHLH